MSTYRSMPRVVCANLVETFLAEHQDLSAAARAVKHPGGNDEFELSLSGAKIWQAADDSRLPIVVLHDLPEARLKSALRALPCHPDVIIGSDECSPDDEREVLLMRVVEKCNMAVGDVLYVDRGDGSDADAAVSVGMQTCTGDDAVKQLELLNFNRRRALLSHRFGEEVELAHTVLLPLDLNLYDMADTDLLHRRSHFVFDTVLIVEGQVSTSAFSLKIIEKNLGSRAVLLYGIADEDKPPDVAAIAQERLRHIRRSGGVKLILVHTNSAAAADDHNIAEIARGLGYFVEFRTWKTLMSQFEREPAWDA